MCEDQIYNDIDNYDDDNDGDDDGDDDDDDCDDDGDDDHLPGRSQAGWVGTWRCSQQDFHQGKCWGSCSVKVSKRVFEKRTTQTNPFVIDLNLGRPSKTI